MSTESLNTKPIRVALIEDHPLFASGVEIALSSNKQLVISERISDENGIKTSREKFKDIDVLVTDLNLHGKVILPILYDIHVQYPDIKIIALSMFQPWEIGLSENDCFFHGYILKHSGIDALFASILDAINDQSNFDASIQFSQPKSYDGQHILTSREKQIAQLLSEGNQTKEVATKLFLSELTVKTHRQNIFKKLNVRNVVEMIHRLKN
jgi:DNA-binding NarL/FixJ family response regulator